MKHRISVLYQLSRSGGTVLARCLGAMRDIVVLSEINPAGLHSYNPLEQAHAWYGLLTEPDLARLDGGWVPTFEQAIDLIAQRCHQAGKQLLIRDWTHLDYFGVPFATPVYESRLYQSLKEQFHIRQYSMVRHPLDQWLSLRAQKITRQNLSADQFLRGIKAFAKFARAQGFLRYEAFTHEPGAVLQDLCRHLQLTFDPDYCVNWSRNTAVTGDVHGNRAGSQIKPLQRRVYQADEVAAIVEHPDYLFALATLGYD